MTVLTEPVSTPSRETPATATRAAAARATANPATAKRTALPADDVCYRAVAGRDPRFDGWIYVGVTSTGIYCRPSCPARTPRRENCRFFAAAGAAQSAGFRACRRCRPDAVPGSPQWNPRADIAARAMRLIADGVVDRIGVSGLAGALGYSERQLNRLLIAEVGAGPLAIARAQRAQTARVLIENTDLRMADVAFAAGFASVRQFNDTMREVYGRSPSALRHRPHRVPASAASTASTPSTPSTSSTSAAPRQSVITLRLPVRRPFAGRPLFEFLALRAVAGVETVCRHGAELHYSRSCTLPHGAGIIELIFDEPITDELITDASAGALTAVLRLDDLRDLAAAVSRIRRLLDLDADPQAVDGVLGRDPDLGPLVAALPGLRVPGAVSGEEIAIRALIGQQISVAGAATTTAAIVRSYGAALAGDHDHPSATEPGQGHDHDHDHDHRPPSHLFPTAAALAGADPERLPTPRSRGRTLVRLAEALASGRIDLSPGADRDEARARLLALPGIGPWTAGYIALRSLGHPDILLGEDLVVRRELARMGLDPGGRASWAPWRSYATMRLWQASGGRADPTAPAPPPAADRPTSSTTQNRTTR